jgi:hypothetical protein
MKSIESPKHSCKKAAIANASQGSCDIMLENPKQGIAGQRKSTRSPLSKNKHHKASLQLLCAMCCKQFAPVQNKLTDNMCKFHSVSGQFFWKRDLKDHNIEWSHALPLQVSRVQWSHDTMACIWQQNALQLRAILMVIARKSS